MSSEEPKLWILTIMERLSAARIEGNPELVASLERELDAYDERRGYRRGMGHVLRHTLPVRRRPLDRRKDP